MTFSDRAQGLHQRGFLGQGTVVGHLDSGVDGSHPLLSGRVGATRNFDRNGFTGHPSDPTDDDGHGTTTAGLIVGGMHAGRPLGMAPRATLWCGVVIERGAILARLLLGLDWLACSPIRVLCLSVGLPRPQPALARMITALAERDILVVVPIGNNGPGASLAPGDHPAALSVGASADPQHVSPFCGSLNAGVDIDCEKPDVTAPGVDVVTTLAGGRVGRVTGTSGAAASVAGVATILRQAFPRATAATISNAIVETADPSPHSHRARRGDVHADRAADHLRRGVSEVPPPPVLCDTPRDECGSIEPRLISKIDHSSDRAVHDAVIMMRDQGEFVRSSAFRAGDGLVRCTKLRVAPIAIVRARSDRLREILELPGVAAATCTDRDRSQGLSW